MKKKRSAESCGNVGDQSSICLREQQPTKHIWANKTMGRNGRKEEILLSPSPSEKDNNQHKWMLYFDHR
jgi:hypothetical protein